MRSTVDHAAFALAVCILGMLALSGCAQRPSTGPPIPEQEFEAPGVGLAKVHIVRHDVDGYGTCTFAVYTNAHGGGITLIGCGSGRAP